MGNESPVRQKLSAGVASDIHAVRLIEHYILPDMLPLAILLLGK